MKWVTRERPKTDRIACPWLIRRFIDPDAEIVYVPKDEVHAYTREHNAHSFDAPGAEFDHRDGKCTFEVLIDHYGLGGDPALVRLAAIVHAADIREDLHSDPLGPPLAALAQTVAVGLPFVIGGGIKSIYDVTLWRWFRNVPLPEPVKESA